MRTLLPMLGASLVLLAAAWALPAAAQDAKSFQDVPTTHWAYAEITDLQRYGLISGYPTGYFQGKRTLTRYEFAVALKRALDKIPVGSSLDGILVGVNEPKIDFEALAELKRLVYEFQDDLATLGESRADTAACIEKLSRILVLTRERPKQPALSEGNLFPSSDSSRHMGDIGISEFPLVLHSARIGSAGASAGLLDPLSGPTAGGTGLLYPTFTSDFISRFSPDTAPANEGIGLHIDLPLSRSGQLGLTLRNFASANGPDSPPRNIFIYGTNVTLHPASHLTFGAGITHSVTQSLGGYGNDPLGSDNNIYRLNIGYNSGPAQATLGYQILDPHLISNAGFALTNAQGPYTRLSWQFSNSLHSYLGGDFYAVSYGGQPGSWMGSLLTGNIYRGTAGIRWSPFRGLNLSADYEGVLYDLSGATSALGRRAQPIEQYITLGAGLNLSRNAVLKMAYQIINQQVGAGMDDAGVGQSSSSNTSVFTTQLAIHF